MYFKPTLKVLIPLTSLVLKVFNIYIDIKVFSKI